MNGCNLFEGNNDKEFREEIFDSIGYMSCFYRVNGSTISIAILSKATPTVSVNVISYRVFIHTSFFSWQSLQSFFIEVLYVLFYVKL